MSDFEIIPGTPGLGLSDVAHILIPGRGRNATGDDISRAGHDRVVLAASLYKEEFYNRGGSIICSGYKTPGDLHGDDWFPEDLARAEIEGHFGDGRPTAIVAQASHLDRILSIIAPRTLRRGYLGVVVPEAEPEVEDWLPRLASRVILLGMTPQTPGLVAIADRRARRMWRLATLSRHLIPAANNYQTDTG